MPTSLPRMAVAFPLLLQLGCEEYDNLEEACDEKGNFTGKKSASPEGVEVFNRLNCYRRLVGIGKATHDEFASAAAEDTLNYMLLNPDPLILGGPDGVAGYLKQQDVREG